LAADREAGNDLMADISDVEQALATGITNLLYPLGATQASILGVTCRVYRGWPNSATLNSDLNVGIVNVTIASDNQSGKTTTRYLREWRYISVPSSLTAVVTGQTISVGGVAVVGNVIGALVDGLAYAYRVCSGDTPDLVAANLCTVMQTDRIATVHGPQIDLPGATAIIVRIVCDNSASYEGRRQEKDVRAICWCSTPLIRDSLSATIDLFVDQSPFLSLPDNTFARVSYRNTTTSDQSQNALLYRRDLVYCVEYPTIIPVSLPSMLFGAAAINGQITFG
jgi:hypothetical protein